ncbi:MAG TPA: hypothetical protein VNO50_03140 [Pyrinomonadaceae bacterium]|nr:hypothetical protein [Pyrinomonadaceae bacterium]
MYAVSTQRQREFSRATSTVKDAQYRTAWAQALTIVNNNAVCGEDDHECRSLYKAVATGADARILKVRRMDGRMAAYVEGKRGGRCVESQGMNIG